MGSEIWNIWIQWEQENYQFFLLWKYDGMQQQIPFSYMDFIQLLFAITFLFVQIASVAPTMDDYSLGCSYEYGWEDQFLFEVRNYSMLFLLVHGASILVHMDSENHGYDFRLLHTVLPPYQHL